MTSIVAALGFSAAVHAGDDDPPGSRDHTVQEDGLGDGNGTGDGGGERGGDEISGPPLVGEPWLGKAGDGSSSDWRVLPFVDHSAWQRAVPPAWWWGQYQPLNGGWRYPWQTQPPRTIPGTGLLWLDLSLALEPPRSGLGDGSVVSGTSQRERQALPTTRLMPMAAAAASDAQR